MGRPKTTLTDTLARRLGAAVALAANVALRLTSRRAGVALVYHRTAERTGDPDRELVPAHGRDLFTAQVRHLRRRYRPVAASELLAAAAARRPGQRFPVAVTFDDDLACHRACAAPILRGEGVPATFFLTGASLSGPNPFWWERLQAAVDRGAVIPALLGDGPGAAPTLHEASMAVISSAPSEREAIERRLAAAPEAVIDEPGLGADDVRALVADGFSIGFHTRRHGYLPLLDDGALVAAMRDGREELEALAGPLDAIAYPYGGYDGRVLTAARTAGFRHGFTTRPLPAVPGSDPLAVGRLEPSFRTAGHFALQLVRALVRRQW